MIKKFLIIFLFILSSIIKTYAFEDVIITTKGKLTDIRIENNQIVDIYPLITIANEKNTLIVHPLAVGQTCFTVMKNEKEKLFFQIKITEDETVVRGVEGVDILTLDAPPESIESFIDEPPILRKEEI